MKTQSKMQRLDITFPNELIEQIDVLVEQGGYASRSEVLRNAFRKLYLDYLRGEAARTLPKNYDSVRAVRQLKKRRWIDALRRAKGSVKKAQDMIMDGSSPR
jgi:Arc/MetJ-type ribon-helix-helix transcriptional regulator